MEPRRKKIVLLTGTSIFLLAIALIAVWRITVWHKVGWTGMIVGHEKKIRKIFYGSPADKAGLQVGDEVIALEGISADSTKQLEELPKRKAVGDTLIYRIIRRAYAVNLLVSNIKIYSRGHNDVEFSSFLTLSMPFKSKHIIIRLIISTTVALIFWVIGFFVFWKKSEDGRARVFYVMSVVAATFFLIYPVVQLDSRNLLELSPAGLSGKVVTTVFPFLFILLATLTFHFALIFPKEREVVKKNPYVFRWIYGLPIVALSVEMILWLAVKIHRPTQIAGEISWGKFITITFSPPTPSRFDITPLSPPAVLTLDIFLLLLGTYLFLKLKDATRLEGWRQWFFLRPLTAMSLTTLSFFIAASLLVRSSVILTDLLKLPSIILEILIALLAFTIGFGTFYIIGRYLKATKVTLLSSYHASSIEEKRQLRWPLWGILHVLYIPIAIGLLKFVLSIVLAISNRGSSPFLIMLTEVLETILYLIIPAFFTLAILKYRLMDIDLIIKKTIIYALVTGIVLTLYFVLVVGVGNLVVNYTDIKSPLVTSIFTLCIAVLFVPVRNRVQNVVDRRFFRKKYDYPTALKNLTRELSQVVEQQAMLKLVAEQLQPALQNRSVVIFSRGTYDRAYVATAKVGLPDEIIGQLKFEMDSKLLAMMESPFEVRTKDFSEAERLTLRKAGSAFIVPIKLKNELIGFIVLGTKLSDEDYDAEDKDFLTSVAEQMGAGVERIRLREQERDFEKAREIQQGLLPKQIPQLAGYEIACAWQPARAVAGDYYDVIKLSESALGICIADVVGKGMPAALLMSNLQAIVRAMASEDMPPKQLCEKVNRVISSNMTPDKFITFFYCLLNAQNKKLVYTNAGHNRPILFHQDGSWIELKEGGLALGMSRERTFEQGEIELKSGDRLLLFTDGVTEVVNTEREEFGEERLLELLGNNLQLRATDLQKKIIEAVTEFSRGEFQDDVTLIAISVE